MMPPAIPVTFFTDYAAQFKREEMIDPVDLARQISAMVAAEKARLPWLKLARFGDNRSEKRSLRHDANLRTVSGCEGDYDGEKISFDQAVAIARAAGLFCIIYTSPSHTGERPRWRVLCPTSRELPPAERTRLMARLNGLYGGIFAVESFTLSQSYYFGHIVGSRDHRVELVDGTCIDLLDELDAGAIGKPNGAAGDGASANGSGGPLDEDALSEQIISGESYHTACVRLVGKWAQAGVPFLDAQRKLEALFDDVSPAERDQRWRERRADIPRVCRDIYGKDAGKEDAAAAQRAPAPGLGEWDAGEDGEPIPPRGWLLGNILCRRFVSSLVADGGVGKTAVRIAQCLALASGKPITEERVFQRCRVLLVSLEDDRDELRRRVKAAMMHYKLTTDNVRGWLFLAAPGLGGGKLATSDGGKHKVGALAAELDAVIVHRAIDAVCLDPFVKSHSVEENANNAVDFVTGILAETAIRRDCAVDAPHHISKGPADPGNANRGRGAGSFKDGARLVYTLSPMSDDEADQFGLDREERRALIRMDSGKVNIAPPAITAKWFQLVGVRIGNPTLLYPHGDEVQVAKPWDPPDMWAAITPFVANAILDKLDADLPDGRRYSPASQAKDRAAWRVVQEAVPKLTEAQAKQVVATWVRNGVIEARTYRDPVERRDSSGVHVNPAKRPG